MLTLEISDFMLQLKEQTIHNVGGPTKSATVKMYDITEVEGRAFGDNRVKLAFSDAEGNNVEIALFPDEVRQLEDDFDAVRSTGMVDGLSTSET